MKEETRNRIILFSFVLTVFVIWLHAGESLISSIPGQIAVPGFFILSGFLFYVQQGRCLLSATGTVLVADNGSATGTVLVADNGEGFFPAWMGRKLLHRLRTLLIPYLIWNLLYFVIYLIAGKTTFAQLPQAVFHYSCNPVFWYLFQLNLITAMTPLLWFLLKRKTTAIIWLSVIFTAAVFYGKIHTWIPVIFINEDALFYYSAGAFLALHVAKRKPVGKTETCGESKKLIGISIGVFAGLTVFFTAMCYLLPGSLINIGVIGQRLCGALFVWFLLGLFKKVRIFPWMKITFFIYATHYMVIRAVWAAEIAMGLNETLSANIVTYLLMPAVCVAAAYGLYILMKKLVPKVLNFLTGSRGY